MRWPRGFFIDSRKVRVVNVTIENLAPCRKLLRLELDAQAVDVAFEEMTRLVQRQVTLPGFRPGKAPKEMVVKSHSKTIHDEVRRKLVNDSYRKAIEDNKLDVVAGPDFEEVQFGPGQSMQFTATIDTAPEFELPEYKGLKATREVGTIAEQEIDKAIEVLRNQRVTYNDVDRPTQTGDFVVVDYSATTDGQPLTTIAPTARGLTNQTGFWMQIKEGHFIPGFTEQLVGAGKGDKRTVNVDFPADFVSAPLQGKKGVYEVTVTQVKESVLPQVDLEFAKSWGADSMEILRVGIRSDLQSEADNRRTRDVRSQLIKQLQDAVTCELPESMINSVTREVVYEVVRENQQRGVSKEEIDQHKNEIFTLANNSAKDRVKISFLLSKVAEKEDLRVSRESLTTRLITMANQNKVAPEKYVNDLKKKNGINQVHEQLLLELAVDFLVNNAVLEEVQAPLPQATA